MEQKAKQKMNDTTGQSKRMSTVEAISSTIIGYVVAMCLYMVVLPMYGHETTWGQSFQVTFIFASVSILRGYLVRRFFNWLG